MNITIDASTTESIETDDIAGPIIEGWKKVDLKFTVPDGLSSGSFELKIQALGGDAYIDDVRLHPYRSGIKTYVYDPHLLKLVAELDNQNYATFYNYDEEGALIQVKKETVRGIVTLQQTRNNTRRNN